MVTWPRPRTARTCRGGGSVIGGAGRSRSVRAPSVANQAIRAERADGPAPCGLAPMVGSGLGCGWPARLSGVRRLGIDAPALWIEELCGAVARARVEVLHGDHRLEHLLDLRGRERVAKHVVAEGVPDRRHDDSLVERQVRVRDPPGLDVHRVVET